MNVEHVPAHRLFVDDEAVIIQYADLDARDLRASFRRNANELTFQSLVEERTEDVLISDAVLGHLPVAPRDALRRRGFDLHTAGDDDEQRDAQAAVAATERAGP